MKAITLRSQVLEAVDRWKKQYRNPKGDKLRILTELEALDLAKTTPKDLEKIMGNQTWACSPTCDECEKVCPSVVELGEEVDWESATARICEECLEKALKLIKGD